MHILVKFPSRSRPDALRTTFLKYIQFAEDTSKISFLVSLDEDDQTVTRSLQIFLKKVHPSTTVVVGRSCGKIGAINRDMDLAPPFDILLLASDDMIPIVKGYDRIIRNNMPIDTDMVLHFNDGHRADSLNTLCILGKKYYDRFGYIYYPEYKSEYCDNEFTDVARALNKQVYFSEVIIKHEHPLWTGATKDELYIKNDKYISADKDLYNKRQLAKFP